jgi:cob(I)alamin adenosyltransferase
MVVLNKIYTKTGDNGKTSLGNGKRVEKFSPRVAAYGSVDELNSSVGIARLKTAKNLSKDLKIIQNDLFDLGADLCKPLEEKGTTSKENSLRMINSQVKRLEDEIDIMNKKLEPLNSFILPGGTETAAYLHLCRTICRRAEREATYLATLENINPNTIKYLNRLSDWFFVAARVENDLGKSDILWIPGSSR